MQYIRKWNHLSKQRDTILTHCRHPLSMNGRFGILVRWVFWHFQCHRSINLLKLQTRTNASALIPHTLCHREINGCSSSSPGKCRPSNSKCFWKVASGLMFPASCLFCHACQSCDTSSFDICPDFVLYAEMHFFLQLCKVGLSKTFHLILILFSCHDDTPQFYHLNCSFTMVTSVPSLHLLLTLTIDLIAKVHDYYLKIYYRYYICYYSGIPGIWGCFK